MSSYTVRISDPSGEVRFLTTQNEMSIGRSYQCDIVLRDPTVSENVGRLSQIENQKTFWLQIEEPNPPAKVSGIQGRFLEVPIGACFQIGETRLTVENTFTIKELPAIPSYARPWKTCSPMGADLLWMARKAATTPLAVYIGGETGTGKEVIAELIHAWSDRARGEFVAINCGALPAGLAESELFGHVKGAFTGAAQQRTGACTQAHNGTLFLDEVADLTCELQVKLLRFLESGEVRPVGSDRTSRVNVRILCATHKPLKKLVEEGKFRRDLYYRLASVTIEIPALKTRPDDIEYLALNFIKDLGKSLTQKAILRLKAHSWPGNVRELRHAIERASGLADSCSSVIDEEAFEFLYQNEDATNDGGEALLSLAEMERFLILKSLRLTGGNRAQASKVLGVARSTLFEMMKRHRILGPKKGLREFENQIAS